MRNPFKKNSAIKYRFEDEKYNDKEIAEELINEIIVKATPKSSCWWNKLPPTVDGIKDYVGHLRDVHSDWFRGINSQPFGTIYTAKACPGLVKLFSKTYLIKAPCDVFISVQNKEYAYNSANDLVTVSSHDNKQFITEDNKLFDGKFCVKICIEINTSMDKDVEYLIEHPVYHNNPDFFVPTGLISSKYAKSQPMHIITLVDLDEDGKAEINIKAGDVLAYMIPFKEMSGLEFSKKDFTKSVVKKKWSIKSWY